MKGFVNINKPIAVSSAFVVQKVKRAIWNAYGEKMKVGHFGTLDPMARGVLPIAVGTATRLFDYAQAKTKIYQATFKFGVETDTLDSEGSIVKTDEKPVKKEDIISALKGFVGAIDQVPPMYSAKSIDGKRAYQLARNGESVELEPKRIEIFDFKLIEDANGKVLLQDGERKLEENEYAFEIACSSGTYIRALARDLAAALGTVGYMSSLLRVQSGAFSLKNSVSLDDFLNNPQQYILPLEIVTDAFCTYNLDEKYAEKVLNGVKLNFDNLPTGDFVVKIKGEIVGIATNQNEILKFKTRL